MSADTDLVRVALADLRELADDLNVTLDGYTLADTEAAVRRLEAQAPTSTSTDPAVTRRIIRDAVGSQVHHWVRVLGYGFETVRPPQVLPVKQTAIYRAGHAIDPGTFPLP
jgi:hypothetical protein